MIKSTVKVLSFVTIITFLLGVILTGCSTPGQTPVESEKPATQATDAGTEVSEADLIGTGAVKFDPSKDVSGKLSVWFYDDGQRFIQPLFDDYQAYRPNVNLEVTYLPWNDYWTKLPVSLASGVGPDLYYFHNMHHTTVVDEGLQAPYPDELIEGLKQDFVNIDQFYFGDSLYYAPVGGGHGMIYYNKTLWAEAGLTEADIPETWDELHEIALMLTKHENGNLTVTGFNGTPSGAYLDWVYLAGYFLYSEDGSEVMLNQSGIKEIYEYFLSWEDDGIFSTTFQDPIQAFRDGKAAMIWQHPWLAGNLKAQNPELDFGVFSQPRYGDNERGWHYNNPDCSMGINAAVSEEGKALAADMLTLFFAEDKYLKEWALGQGLSPTKMSLMEDEELNTHPIISVQIEGYGDTVFNGGSSAAVDGIIQQELYQALFIGGAEWDDIIEDVVENCNKALAETDWRSKERLSSIADELK